VAPRKQTLLIVDDYPLFREGIKALLSREPDFEVVGEAENARTAEELAEKLRPDIAVVDVSLPDMSGVQLTRDLMAAYPKIRVVLLSGHSRMSTVTEAFQAGAAAYVTKASASSCLLEALQAVSRGELFLDGTVSGQVVKRLLQAVPACPPIRQTQETSLTLREQEVLKLIAEGLSTKEVASRLHISPKTAENHRASIMSKLNLRNIVELIRSAARLGIIDLDAWKE